MGLIKALKGAAGGMLADQWKEYFYCEALASDVLAAKGQKRVSGRSSNTQGNDNIISNGSIIAVADGQCMLIVEQGKVVDVCAEPGEYTYDMSTEPSIFAGGLNKENILGVLSTVGKRFTFGGDTAKDQRIYYFNTKELIGNKYGTASPVPFRVVDERAGIDIDISIRCFGEYSYKVVNPLLLYTNVCGNVTSVYKRSELDSQMKSELLTALQPAFARISAMGVRYSALPGHTQELAEALREELSAKWRDYRGIEIQSVGVSSVKANEEDEQMIKELQRNAAFMDPTRAAAHLVGAQASAMQAAANNQGGAAMAFMGMNMAQNAGGFSPQNLYAMGQQQAMQQQAMQIPREREADEMIRRGVSPEQMDMAKAGQVPPAAGWTCSCGSTGNTGKFCMECGSPKPAESEGWTCACGSVNKGKFCPECGAKKPAGVPQYRCDKCGWEPEKGSKAPKFCPECGDPFDNGDLV